MATPVRDDTHCGAMPTTTPPIIEKARYIAPCCTLCPRKWEIDVAMPIATNIAPTIMAQPSRLPASVVNGALVMVPACAKDDIAKTNSIARQGLKKRSAVRTRLRRFFNCLDLLVTAQVIRRCYRRLME